MLEENRIAKDVVDVGLLIDFGEAILKNGIHRVVNDL
jgi:hypothetical protein